MPAAEDDQDAIEQIRQIRRDIERAERDQDGTLLETHLAEDVVMAPADGPRITGATAVVAYHRDLFDDWGEMDVEFSIEQITVIGGLATETGTYEFTMIPPDDDEPQRGGGEYLYTYDRRPDGTWAIRQMSWGQEMMRVEYTDSTGGVAITE